ncbi:hypothetical protein [Roseateles sp.]|uniref:hypothetical protein n=1 Tax=Roseateles sp. TaxID=1971397 RepID=UPI0039EC29C1
MKRALPPTWLSLLLAAALAGCASTPAGNEQVAVAKDKDVVCDREEQLGSMFSKVKCRTVQQKETERADAAAFGDNLRHHSPTPVGK